MKKQPIPITATMLYDLVSCPHRVTMDLYADPADRDEPNAFVELLWERGALYEREVMEGFTEPYCNLSSYSGEEKEQLTFEAMERGETLIYSGRIRADGLLGEPDLLRKQGSGYIAGDIKSGSGEEGPEDNSKPKIHYAVQLGLYTDILKKKGLSGGHCAFVLDIHGKEVLYDFEDPYGKRNPRTLWQDYQEALEQAREIVGANAMTLPAYGGVCKLCHWYSACVKRLKDSDDLTMIPELGRSKRDVMYGQIKSVSQLAELNVESFLVGNKTTFPGIGPDTLKKFHERARLLTTGKGRPYTRTKIQFPESDRELFFDIEVDPMRDICYLHGFVERRKRNNGTEVFVSTMSDEPTPNAEKKAFVEAWKYIQHSRPCTIYYYSKYERTIYRILQAKYPDVCSPEEVEEIFNPAFAIDLYNDVVKKHTEWPTWDFSIKTLAKYLGFSWRDTHPSGAASIEWFNRWVETGDPEVRKRILDYNEDDCRATRVLRDALENLPISNGEDVV